MLAETVKRWQEQALQEGLQKGLQEGLQEGRQQEAAKLFYYCCNRNLAR